MTFRATLKRIAYFGPAAYVRLFWDEPRRDRLLSKWQTPNARTAIERLLFKPVFDEWIRTVYLTETDPDRRETLKSICMGGDSGEAWAEEYENIPLDRTARLHDLSFEEACPWYGAIDEILRSSDPGTLVVQIGASSGREIALFAQYAPDQQFVGTDIDKRIVGRAAARHVLPNLRFEVSLAHQLVSHLPTSGEVVLYSSGSLQYVQPEHLVLMFRIMKERGNVRIVVGETWSADGSRCGKNSFSRYRGNFSYSHNYREYAEEAGFHVKDYELVQIARNPRSPHYHTRHYFLHVTA